MISAQHQRYRGVALVYIVVLDNESHGFGSNVCGWKLAAVIPHEKGVVAAGDLASVIHQTHGFPDIGLRFEIILIESIKVAEQSRAAAEATVCDQRPRVKQECSDALPPYWRAVISCRRWSVARSTR